MVTLSGGSGRTQQLLTPQSRHWEKGEAKNSFMLCLCSSLLISIIFMLFKIDDDWVQLTK